MREAAQHGSARACRQVVLVFRGTNSNSDWLTDLRCANVAVRELARPAGPAAGGAPDAPAAPGVQVHAGIWAAALLADQVSPEGPASSALVRLHRRRLLLKKKRCPVSLLIQQ